MVSYCQTANVDTIQYLILHRSPRCQLTYGVVLMTVNAKSALREHVSADYITAKDGVFGVVDVFEVNFFLIFSNRTRVRAASLFSALASVLRNVSNSLFPLILLIFLTSCQIFGLQNFNSKNLENRLVQPCLLGSN